MNNSLLQAAKIILENQTAIPNNPYAALWSMGLSYCDTDSAKEYLQQSIIQEYSLLPLQGVALHHLYQNAKDKKKAKAIVEELYEAVLNRHRNWYEKNDLEEEGLPHTPDEYKRIQDPLFVSLLVWSNECLIELGHLLKEDVLEIIQWNELTIYSANEKLWKEEQGGYQPYDQIVNHLIGTTPPHSFAPMAGEIPTQDQAELMLPVIQKWYRKAEQLNIFELWLLRRGLLRYDFVEIAAQIRRQLLQYINEHGFYEDFDSKSGEPLNSSQNKSPLTAALIIDLIKRC